MLVCCGFVSFVVVGVGVSVCFVVLLLVYCLRVVVICGVDCWLNCLIGAIVFAGICFEV